MDLTVGGFWTCCNVCIRYLIYSSTTLFFQRVFLALKQKKFELYFTKAVSVRRHLNLVMPLPHIEIASIM